MKKLALLIILFAQVRNTDAQASDSIPNAGFESWIWVGWFVNPEGWMTNNNQLLVNTVVEDTNEYSGTYAMMLVNGGAFTPLAWCGFPIIHHPATFSGYLKNQLFNNDTASILVQLYYQNTIVDSGYQVLTGGINPAYTLFSIPISQHSPVADSCVITLNGGTVYMSSVSFDDIYFTFPTGIPTVDPAFTFAVGPNPVHDVLYIHVPCNTYAGKSTIMLYDLTGKQILERELVLGFYPFCGIGDDVVVIESFAPIEAPNTINVQDLSKGVYLMTVQMNSKSGSQLIIKE